MKVSDLHIRIRYEGGELKTEMVSDLDRAGRKTDQLATKAKNVGRQWSQVGTIVKAAAAAYMANNLIKAAEEQVNAVAKLNASLKAAGNYSQAVSVDMQGFASSMQAVTTYGDEAVIGLEALLINFGLTTDEVKQITPAILDMATAMGMDLQSAGLLISKTLDGNVGAMGRYISGLDKAQVETEGAAYLTEELNQRFEGQARALAETEIGGLKQYSNLLGDVKEDLGILIAGGLRPLITEGLQPATEWFHELDKGTQGAIGTLVLGAITIRTVLIPALRALQVSMGPGGWLLAGLGLAAAALAAYSSAADEAKTSIVNLQDEQAKLNQTIQEGTYTQLRAEIYRYRFEIIRIQEEIEKYRKKYEQAQKSMAGRASAVLGIESIYREVTILEQNLEKYKKLLEQAREAKNKLLSGETPGDTGKGGESAEEAGFSAANDLAERMLRIKLELAQSDAERIEIYQALLELQRAEMEMAERGSEEWISAMEEAVSLEQEIQGFKDEIREEEIAKQEEAAERQNEIDAELHQAKLDRLQALQAASDTFWQTMLDVEMSGAERSKAVWRAMTQVALQQISRSMVAYLAGEKSKTAASSAGAAARLAQGAAHFAAEMALAVKGIAAGVYKFYAALGPFGIPLAAMTVAGMIAAIRATAFGEGGEVDRPTLAMIGERGEAELVMPKRNFMQVFNEDILPEVRDQVRMQVAVALEGGGSQVITNNNRPMQVVNVYAENVLGGEDAWSEVVREGLHEANRREGMK